MATAKSTKRRGSFYRNEMFFYRNEAGFIATRVFF